MILNNCKIFTMDGEKIIQNGYIKIDDDKITEIGEKPYNGKGEIVDLHGNIVTPGFIDSHTHMGVFASGVGFEGEDCNEDTSPLMPQLRTIDGVNPTDPYFDEALKCGITTVLTGVGSANPIGGDIIAMNTRGNRVDNMLIKRVGIKFAFGENPKCTYKDKEETPTTRMGTAALMREQLFKVLEYKNLEEPDYDIKCESLIPLLDGDLLMFAHVHRADDIFTAIRIAGEFNLSLVLIHATESYLVADELEKEDISRIIGPLIGDRSKPELAKYSVKNILNCNIPTAIATDHPEIPINFLQLSAQLAVKNGMDKYQALKTITSSPAKIVGIDDYVGRIKVGLQADIIVHSTEPMDFYDEILQVYVKGVLV